MEQNRIKELLDKFWEGETSLDEEKELKAFFQHPNTPPEFAADKAYFTQIAAEKAAEMPEKRPGLALFSRISRMALAACVLGLVGLGFWKMQCTVPQPKPEALALTDTYDDPEKAYTEIKAALALVSTKMKKSRTEAVKGIDKIGRARLAVPHSR